MAYQFFQIDAFTSEVFKGNPAAVMPLNEWLPDDILLKIAKEHNQSETAFFIPLNNNKHDYELRWFTPAAEVDLCGHATLAASFVIFNHLCFNKNVIVFKTRFAGDLFVERKDDWLEMDFPARLPQVATADHNLIEAMRFKTAPLEILKNEREWYFVFENKYQVLDIQPDFMALSQRADWQCITAKGDDCDFVSRFFTANAGIIEDPVTGSTHCSLVPYWSSKLNKNEMTARQLSARGGFLKLGFSGSRVKIAGQAVLYARGGIPSLK